jgi:hypothetical protein
MAVTIRGLSLSGLGAEELKGIYFDNALRILPGAAWLSASATLIDDTQSRLAGLYCWQQMGL